MLEVVVLDFLDLLLHQFLRHVVLCDQAVHFFSLHLEVVALGYGFQQFLVGFLDLVSHPLD